MQLIVLVEWENEMSFINNTRNDLMLISRPAKEHKNIWVNSNLWLTFNACMYINIFLKISHVTDNWSLRLLHTMNVRFSLLDIAQRILAVTLPNFQ
jgi:hypothetical protein